MQIQIQDIELERDYKRERVADRLREHPRGRLLAAGAVANMVGLYRHSARFAGPGQLSRNRYPTP